MPMQPPKGDLRPQPTPPTRRAALERLLEGLDERCRRDRLRPRFGDVADRERARQRLALLAPMIAEAFAEYSALPPPFGAEEAFDAMRGAA